MTRVMLKYPSSRLERITSKLIETCDWLPTVADFVRTADSECADLLRQQEREARVMLPAPEEEDRSKRLTYSQLCAKYGGDGRGKWGLTEEKPKRPWWPSVDELKQLAGKDWDNIPEALAGPWKKL